VQSVCYSSFSVKRIWIWQRDFSKNPHYKFYQNLSSETAELLHATGHTDRQAWRIYGQTGMTTIRTYGDRHDYDTDIRTDRHDKDTDIGRAGMTKIRTHRQTGMTKIWAYGQTAWWRYGRTDRQTDRQTGMTKIRTYGQTGMMIIITFRHCFADAPKNEWPAINFTWEAASH
jgi:hypothetical protein